MVKEAKAKTPEQIAREWIDAKLEQAGWCVVDRKDYLPSMGAAAIREVILEDDLRSDYLLMLGGKAAGVLEAKKADISLDSKSLIAQAEGYTTKLRDDFPAHEKPLRLIFLSNGKQIAFKDGHEENAAYEIIKDFPRPKDLVQKLRLKDPFAALPYFSKKGLRDCQFEAARALETHLKKGNKRALLSLATGSGKTFLACFEINRLLSFANFKRVLFLVDRTNLGVNAEKAFGQFTLTENNLSLSNNFHVQRLSNSTHGTNASVVISTIQRLYSILTGKNCDESDAEAEKREEENAKALDTDVIATPLELPHELKLPKDYFDLIVVDECHRSIYSRWKKVLERFEDATIIGMTATPIPETIAFFDGDPVYEYNLEKSYADGVNVPPVIYRIKTEISERGGTIKKGEAVTTVNRRTYEEQKDRANEEMSYSEKEVNRSVLVPDQIRTVLQEYKDAVYNKMFSERVPDFNYLPKTLIFAESEAHAKEIVKIAKEVFERTDDQFVQQITYSSGNSDNLIRSFRQDANFRIAVTVTLMSTGTDVQAIEVVMFLRDVRSETLYIQMKGRGVRSIRPEDLREVTPNATSKDSFFLVDAVGVSISEKKVPVLQGGGGTNSESKPTPRQLVEKLSHGDVQDTNLTFLAQYLFTVQAHGGVGQIEKFSEYVGITPEALALQINEAIEKGTLPQFISVQEPNTERMDLISDFLCSIEARDEFLRFFEERYLKILPEQKDRLISTGCPEKDARESTEAFKAYIESHKDDIEALRLIYNHNGSMVTRAMLNELEEALKRSLPGFSCARMWDSYKQLEPSKVADLKEQREVMTNLIQLVRYANGMIPKLWSLAAGVAKPFELWLGQAQRELNLSEENKDFLKKVAEYVAQNGKTQLQSLQYSNPSWRGKLVQIFSSAQAANDQLMTLSSFILNTKAA